jgi:hypothetical protein
VKSQRPDQGSTKLSDAFEWNGEIASTGVAGARLQRYSGLPLYPGEPVEKVLEALKRLNVSPEDEPLLNRPFMLLHCHVLM